MLTVAQHELTCKGSQTTQKQSRNGGLNVALAKRFLCEVPQVWFHGKDIPTHIADFYVIPWNFALCTENVS